MTSADPTAVIILSEIVALETIAIFSAIILLIIKRRKKTKHISETLKRIDEETQNRKAYIANAFAGKDSSPDESINTISESVVNAENAFYENILKAFFSQRILVIDEIDSFVRELTLPYEQFANIPSPDNKGGNEQSHHPADIDDAIDELLTDDGDGATDPALDLSAIGSMQDNENDIAEIPDDLLTDSEFSEKSSAEDSSDNKEPAG